MSQDKRVILVTGAARGIGKAILERLASSSTIAVGVDYNQESADLISTTLQASGRVGEGLVMDVTKPEMVEEVVSKIIEKYGPITILVNNAGITRDNLLMRMSRSEWDQVIATNLTSIFNVSHACINAMVKARWGRIINIASVVGVSGNPGQTNYSATKAGVIGFSKSLAIEVASRNITVNCVAPGFIETDMTKKLSDVQRERLIANVPMKRIGSAGDIANAVEFLASDAAAYITGTTLHVNGGLYLT